MDTSEENFADRSDIVFKIDSGELLLHDITRSRGRIWRVFSRVANREGVELDFVCCKNCEKVFKYNPPQTSNLCRHRCYVEKFAENELLYLEEEKSQIQAAENSLGRRDVVCKIASGGLLLHNKTTSKGRIWRIFSRVANREGVELDFVCCKTCDKVYKYNPSQTSNLCRHSCYMQKFADNEFLALEDDTPQNQTVEVRVNNLTQLLTKWVIHNCYSYDLIESEGLKAIFHELLKLGEKFGDDLDVDILLPSLLEISDNVSDVFNCLLVSIKKEISLVKENGFGLTADIWMDDLSKETYIAITVHYLKNSKLTHRLLGFQIFEDSIENINQILEEFDLQLSDKCFLVTDGSFSRLKPYLGAQNLPCISELLKNVILESVEKIPDVMEIINFSFKLVNFFGEKALNPLSKKLTQKSHHNRSITICKMLTLILIHMNEIEQELQDTNDSKFLASNKNKLIAITDVLQPFAEAIETLEDNSQATLHLVMVYMHELVKFCQTTTDDYKRYSCVKQLQTNMCLHLEEVVMKKITILHKIAVFLYPPTNKLLPYSDKEKQCIEDECVGLLRPPLIKQVPEEQPPVAAMCKLRRLLADFLQSEALDDTDEIIRQEIRGYKNTHVAFSPNFNPFDWWDLKKDNFPLLYRLSCTVLATPATSAASKQIFSNAKSLLSQKFRRNLTNADIERIIFISSNAPAHELGQYFTS